MSSHQGTPCSSSVACNTDYVRKKSVYCYDTEAGLLHLFKTVEDVTNWFFAQFDSLNAIVTQLYVKETNV